MSILAHETAIIDEGATIGEGTKIWHFSHIRSTAKIGKGCTLGKGTYIDRDVIIGNNVKIQNGVSIWQGVTIEDDVFIGPHVVFTNDLYPRAKLWQPDLVKTTVVKKGASLGANATILCGDLSVGSYAMVGAGSVVTKNVPAYALVIGNPARIAGFVCECGNKLIWKNKLLLICCNKCDVSTEKISIE